MSRSMPTLLLSRHQRQWEGVDSGCAGAVSFSDSSCLGLRLHEVSLPPEKTQPSLPDLLLHHPNLLILHWERHLQVKTSVGIE